MATGLAIGVTVAGIAAILALLGVLARQLGLWSMAINWMKATSEEKTKLCRPERIPTTSGRPYLQLDNDLDWINLWPRSGSYKRFSNFDESEDAHINARINANIFPEPPIPPQPLRPAPGPPHRMPLRYDTNDRSSFGFPGSGMLMGMMKWDNRAMHHYNGIDRSMPVLDRRDSERSINSRNMKNLGQDYQQDLLTSSLPRKASTNPFRSGLTHASSLYSSNNQHYSNPFSPGYQYQQAMPRHFQAIEEDNRINHSLIDDRLRHGYRTELSRSDHHIYTNNYEEYSRLAPIHNQSLDRGIDRLHGQAVNRDRVPGFNNFAPPPERVQNSSQIAYSHSLNQALVKQRKLQQNIQQQIYINRYDKIKQDEERINEEERILHQLRYENDLLRRERFENSLQNNQAFNLNGLNSNIYDIEETRELEREAIRENIVYNFQKGASDIREEFEKRLPTPKIPTNYDHRSVHHYDMDNYTSPEIRDSPPPPAPDEISNISYPDSPETTSKDSYMDWRDRSRDLEGKGFLDIPATPPNTASLTPPNTASITPPYTASSRDSMLSSMINPYSKSLLQKRLIQVKELRYKDSENETLHDHMQNVKNTIDASLRNNLNAVDHINGDDTMYPMVFAHSSDDDIGGELTQKLHALQEGRGIDVYPRALKERIERRREREGSRRKRKRDRELERRSSFKQLGEAISNEKVNNVSSTQSTVEVSSSLTDNKVNDVELEDEDDAKDKRHESALNNVPIGLENEPQKTNQLEPTVNVNSSVQEGPGNALTVANVASRNLEDSPVVPRKSFLSYKGPWNDETKTEEDGNRVDEEEEEEEEDANTLRVREYIASLSARLQQLPEKDDDMKPLVVSPPVSPPAPIVSFPITPPNSAARTNSQSSIETPSSSAATWGSVHAWRLSSETPPNSATGVSSRPSYSDTPPSSAGLYGNQTPPNSANSSSSNFIDTPPPSTEFPGTPHNSSSEINGSFDLSSGEIVTTTKPLLKRAQSCDSVSSDTSITLGELEEGGGQVTGYLTVQVIYEGETADLEVVVIEGRDLVSPDATAVIDSYVRVFLLPDKTTNMQTRIYKRSNNPSYKERFLFALEEEELLNRHLVFYVYSSDKFTNTLIGEAQMKLGETELRDTSTTELTLLDSGQKGFGHGEIMFSLSYLQTAERLTVVIVKARSLQFSGDKVSGDPFVKVYILQNGKKIMKKKTNVKKDTNSPVFNEAMSFNISAPSLNNIQLRLTVAENPVELNMPACPIGHVIVGTQATGKALSHWNQMMSSLRKPIGMWHALRR